MFKILGYLSFASYARTSSPSSFCHENHVFHWDYGLPPGMPIQSPCGQTWTIALMDVEKVRILTPHKEPVLNRYLPIVLYHFTLSYSSKRLKQWTDIIITHLNWISSKILNCGTFSSDSPDHHLVGCQWRFSPSSWNGEKTQNNVNSLFSSEDISEIMQRDKIYLW